jgi:hypothetical protein
MVSDNIHFTFDTVVNWGRTPRNLDAHGDNSIFDRGRSTLDVDAHRQARVAG